MKKASPKKSGKDKSLNQLVRTFGKQNRNERANSIKLWEKAKKDYYSKGKSVKQFNPTTMSYEIFENFLKYLQITLIDEQIQDNQQDFIPTQNYEQELRREFRRKGVKGSILFDGNEDNINRELAKIKKRDDELSGLIHFLETVQDSDHLPTKAKQTGNTTVEKLW